MFYAADLLKNNRYFYILLHKNIKQMFHFITRVQVAAIFSFCLAWDELIPERNNEFLYESDETHSPGKIEHKLELAENFTQFLRRNNKDLDEYNSAKPKDHAGNVWSRLEKNFNNRKLATSTIDVPTSTSKKYNFMDYETNLFRFSTKKTHLPIRNTIFPNMNLFRTDDQPSDVEGFQVMKLLEEPEPDGTPLAMRRLFSAENTFDLVTNNDLQNEELDMGIDSHDELFNLQKILKNYPPEELEILKHIATAGNFSTATTESLIKKELPKELIERKENDTLKNVAKSNSLNYKLNNTAATANESNNDDNQQTNVNDTNNKLHSTNYEHRLKFENILNRENQIIDILKRQTHLLEQVAEFLDTKQQEKVAVRTLASFKDFENILNEVNKKTELLDKDKNMTQVALDIVNKKLKNLNKPVTKTVVAKAATTKQRMLPTVMTLIDETEVRNALKNDPYVQRIMKMAKRKRTHYLNNAAKYLSS